LLCLGRAAATLADEHAATSSETAPADRERTAAKTAASFFADRADDGLALGFSTGDARGDHLVAVMRLFYLVDLRRLQTAINDILATTQDFVADPKTNTALGKVGR